MVLKREVFYSRNVDKYSWKMFLAGLNLCCYRKNFPLVFKSGKLIVDDMVGSNK